MLRREYVLEHIFTKTNIQKSYTLQLIVMAMMISSLY